MKMMILALFSITTTAAFAQSSQIDCRGTYHSWDVEGCEEYTAEQRAKRDAENAINSKPNQIDCSRTYHYWDVEGCEEYTAQQRAKRDAQNSINSTSSPDYTCDVFGLIGEDVLKVSVDVKPTKPNSKTEVLLGEKIILKLETDEQNEWKPVSMYLKDSSLKPEVNTNVRSFDGSVQTNQIGVTDQGIYVQSECKQKGLSSNESIGISDSNTRSLNLKSESLSNGKNTSISKPSKVSEQ